MQVLGLTVLAWGNSIGDFSTNMAMAKKGLANMALTACYAGPVFNLLVGCLLLFSVPVLYSKMHVGCLQDSWDRKACQDRQCVSHVAHGIYFDRVKRCIHDVS